MCSWFLFSWRKNEPSGNVSHSHDSLVGKGAGEAVTPWRLCARVSLLLCSAGAGRGGALTGSHPDMSNSRWISASLSPTLKLCIHWLAFQLKTVFMIRHQLAEEIYSSWSGAFTKFSQTVPCIDAFNLNKSMTRSSIYRCVANVVVCWVSADFTLFMYCGSCRLQYKTTGTAFNKRLKN